MIVLGEYASSFYDLDFYEDEAATTIYTVGSPNQGKSTLLGNLAEQFCAEGEGVLVLDIKGDMVREIASRTQHPERVVYVKLGEIPIPHADSRYWTINPFDGHRTSDEQRGHIRTAVLESFERLGQAQLDTMANIRNTIQHAIGLALSLPDPTYWDLYGIVASQKYRDEVMSVGNQLNGRTREVPYLDLKFWQDLDNKNVTPTTQRRTQINTARNRLETILFSPSAELTLGWYDSTLKLQQWLDEGKMILVDLGLPLDPYTADNLGNMVMAQLMSEVFIRHDKSRRWRIIVDEFHRFVGDTFADIITQARSYNVYCVLAHQDRSQLEGDKMKRAKGAVGHPGITVRTRGSREDRQALIGLYGPELVDSFYSLSAHTALVSYTHSPPGTEVTELILLKDWRMPPVDGQLERLQQEALQYTKPRKELAKRNLSRYVDHLGIEPIRGSVNGNGNIQTNQKSEVRGKRGQASQASVIPPQEAERPPRPGRRGPARIVDQLDDSGSLLPRPPQDD